MPPSLIIPATPIDVAHLDGKTERVPAARLTILQLYTFVELLEANNTPRLVQMCTGRDAAWIDTLTDESYGALAKACIRENFQRAMVLAASDQIIATKVIPLARRIDLAAQMAFGLATSVSSQAQSSPPDGPGGRPPATPPASSPPSSQSTVEPAPAIASSG